jgi:hypothetical protein
MARRVDFVASKDFEELIHAQTSLYPKVLEVLAAEVLSGQFTLSRRMGVMLHSRL